MDVDLTWAETPNGRRLLDAIRSICERLREVEEVVDGFGHRTFKVRGRSFVIAGMGDDGTHLAFKSDPVSQDLLVRRDAFFRTPYIGQHGWVSVHAPLEHDQDELAFLIEDAWRIAAPKGLVKLLDAE